MKITRDTVVFITGASSGIGQAFARKVAETGAKIALVARRLEKLEALAAELSSLSSHVIAIQADISKRDEAEQAISRAVSELGDIDILLNNAGRGNLAAVEHTTDEMLESMFSVNVFSLWYCTAAVLPRMKERNKGCILNIASVAGKMAFPYNSAYVAAKHAVVGFTAALRAELVDTDVYASVVCPAGVETEWARVTEGGAIGELFWKGIVCSKTIAQERGLELAPLTPMMSAENVAEIIFTSLHTNSESDIFTHEGTKEQSILAASYRPELERQMLPLFLGMKEAYWSSRPS